MLLILRGFIEVNPTMSILIIPAQIQIVDFRYISIYTWYTHNLCKCTFVNRFRHFGTLYDNTWYFLYKCIINAQQHFSLRLYISIMDIKNIIRKRVYKF